MNAIFNFVKDILMLNNTDKTPIGLCHFDCSSENAVKPVKSNRKHEMRLSELMDK